MKSPLLFRPHQSPRPSRSILSASIVALLGLAALTAGSNTASALDPQYWDGTNTTANGVVNGGNGTWINDGSTTNWTNATGTTNAAYDPTAIVASFGGPVGTSTVTLSGNIPFTIAQFTTGGYVLNGPGSLVAGAGGGVFSGTSANEFAVINAVISGGPISLQGGGFTFAGTNTYTGFTEIRDGSTLSVSTDANLGNAAATVTLGSASTHGTLKVLNTLDSSRAVSLGAGGGTLQTSFADVNLFGMISGAGALTKAGFGSLNLTNTGNTYAGGTIVDGGGSVLTYADDAVLGAGGVTLKNDGTIAPTGVQTTTRTFTLESNGHIRNAAGETYTINGAITGPGLLLKNGEGTLILNTANNYTGGTALNRGTLLVNHDNALGTGTLMIETGTFGTNTAGLVLPNDVRIGSSFTLALPGGATGMSVEGNVDFDFFSPVITVQGGTGSFVRFRGSVTGTSTDVTYVGSPGLTFVIYEDGAVATPNTFAGTTTVNDGVALVLNKSTDNSAILGALVIGSGARVDLRDDEQIADTASLIANSQGAGGAKGFRMDGHNETIGALYGDGTIGMENTSTLVAGTLTVGAGDFSGVISDGQLGGRLVKNSPGTLVLRGINTYVGDTTINGGTLIVDGSVRSANVLINPGAQLAGIGTAYGNVVNRGTFAPGNSPGTFTIGGNYAQQMDGTLVIEIAGRNPGEHDLVVVGGHASLDGTLRIVSVNGFKPKAGDKIQILTAAGGVSGQFSDVDNPFTTGTSIGLDLVYLADQVLLEAVQTSFGDIAGLTPNQKSVGRALDKVAFNPKETELISFLNSQSLEQLPHDFDLIAAEEVQAIYSIGISQANIQSGNIARRLDEIRAGAAGFSAAGLAVTGLAPQYSGSYLAPNAGLAGPSGKTSKEIRPPAEENRLGMFVTGVGEWTHIGTTENASGYNLTTGGFTLGLDYKATEHFAFGINAGYARSDARLYGSGNVTVDGGKLGLYATYFNGGFYVDAAVQGGINSYDTRRNALQGTARGSTEGGEVNLLAATGYDWKVGGLTFGPTANFQYTCVAFDGYSERGSLAPLKYSPQSAESVRTAFGVKASYDWHLGGVLLRPEIRAAWQHEFGDQSFGIDAGFANGGGSNFTVNGASIGRDSLLLGGGLAILWNDRISTYVYYDGELARTNYSSNNLTGGFRVSF